MKVTPESVVDCEGWDVRCETEKTILHTPIHPRARSAQSLRSLSDSVMGNIRVRAGDDAADNEGGSACDERRRC